MVVGKTKLMKTRWYPRPHDEKLTWTHGLETGAANQWTMVPLVMYDEGKGAPLAYESNPEHASFAETDEPNCFPESKVDFIVAQLVVSMTKASIETDGLHAIRYAYMSIGTAFIDDYTAINELDSNEIQDVLELTTESTDRQGHPLWNDVKMVASFTGSSTLPAAVPGLTGTQLLEGVTFAQNSYYDMLHYKTNGPKLKSVQGGLRWRTLTRQRPVHIINIKLRSSAKFMNPFALMAVLFGVPKSGTAEQIHVASDTTNINHVNVNLRFRYNEWHQGFYHLKV